MASDTPALPDAPLVPSASSRRGTVKLGLALSGGGFRATLFHLGVLARLAELDLLRHLEVISAVSGGSVLAAHYMLLLKYKLERSADGKLHREEYIGIVQQLGDELADALEHDPRNQVLAAGFAQACMVLLAARRFRPSLAERMEVAYQRLLYRSGTERIQPSDASALKRGVCLQNMALNLPGLKSAGDIQRYNARGTADRVPRLVLNSATLNTAARFTFTFSEVGDEVLGYVRFDERQLIARYRHLLDAWKPGDDPMASANQALRAELKRSGKPDGSRTATAPAPVPFPQRPHLADHLAWWHAARSERTLREERPGTYAEEIAVRRSAPEGGSLAFVARARSAAVRHLHANTDHGMRFLDAPFSVLRVTKVAAWYLLSEDEWRPRDEDEAQAAVAGVGVCRGGRTRPEQREQFWSSIRDVDQVMAGEIHSQEAAEAPPNADETDWYEFALELYYFRAAENLEVERPQDVRLPTAVQASANFPPVFGALHLRGVFDRQRIKAVQLSDGGLNDNNGLEALLEARCTHILASEAGPRPEITSPVWGNRLGLVGQIMLNQLPIVRRLLMRTLREHQRVHGAQASRATQTLGPNSSNELRDLWRRYPVEAVAFFDMDSKLSDGVKEDRGTKTLRAHPLAREIARLRTDLDAFNRIEQEALRYQGYQYCDRFVRRYIYPALAPRLGLPEEPPAVSSALVLPADHEWDHVKRVLRAGGARLGRARLIGGRERWMWWVVTALGVVAVFWLAFVVEVVRQSWLSTAAPCEPFLRWLASVATWLLAVFAWLLVAMPVFGLWLRIDGYLSARAARIPRAREQTH